MMTEVSHIILKINKTIMNLLTTYIILNIQKKIVKNAEKFAYIAFICKTFEINSANFFYEKDNLASLKLEIDYDQINNDKFINSMNNIQEWVEGKHGDYFIDPCNEWKIK